MNRKCKVFSGVVLAGMLGTLASCVPMPPPPGNGNGNGNGNANTNGNGNANTNTNGNDNSTTTPPQEFTDADTVRGAKLYDKWWAEIGAAAPTEDHALWATRPDQQSNTRTGADTWRCKECHGWDYKGVDGAYATGSHRTGFAGVFGTTMGAQEVFDRIRDDHGFADAGLSDADIWDLAKFVLEGPIDTDEIIDASGTFVGDAANGQTLFESGIGNNPGCVICHGADGLSPPPGAPDDFVDFVGAVSNENAWEFQHKVRFGQPGHPSMPSSVKGGGSTMDVGDLGAFAQTLPEAPMP